MFCLTACFVGRHEGQHILLTGKLGGSWQYVVLGGILAEYCVDRQVRQFVVLGGYLGRMLDSMLCWEACCAACCVG